MGTQPFANPSEIRATVVLEALNRPAFDAHLLLRGIMPNKWDSKTKEKLFA
jgi:hypothetical protein